MEEELICTPEVNYIQEKREERRRREAETKQTKKLYDRLCVL